MVDKKTGVKPKKTVKDEPKNRAVKKKEVIAEPVAPDLAHEAKIEVEEKLTKAGKHSAKAKKADDDAQAKEARKSTSKEAVAKPTAKPPRSHSERAGKKYRDASKMIDRSRQYQPQEAIRMLTQFPATKFDPTVELHINLNVDPKQADQN